MKVFGKFVPASLLATIFIGPTVYNLFYQDNMVPMSRWTLNMEELKNEYEAKLAEQLRLHEAQIKELLLAKQQQQQKFQASADGGGSLPSDDTTTTGAATNYQLAYFPHSLKGHQYFLPAYAMTRPAVQSFLRGQYYEPQTHCYIEKLLRRFPGSMVHAGTFFGDMIPHFSTIVHSVSSQEHQYILYAFEPNPRNYLLAQKAVEANELSNVILVNAALGPSVIQQRIQVVGNERDGGIMDLGGNSAVSPDHGTQRVPQLTIDMFNITDLSVIALDTEGFEKFVLQGAMQTLKNTATRPLVVALEDNEGTARAFMAKKLPEYLLVTRKSGLSYFALAKVQKEVKKLLRLHKDC